jgi:hypothetical protein
VIVANRGYCFGVGFELSLARLGTALTKSAANSHHHFRAVLVRSDRSNY